MLYERYKSSQVNLVKVQNETQFILLSCVNTKSFDYAISVFENDNSVSRPALNLVIVQLLGGRTYALLEIMQEVIFVAVYSKISQEYPYSYHEKLTLLGQTSGKSDVQTTAYSQIVILLNISKLKLFYEALKLAQIKQNITGNKYSADNVTRRILFRSVTFID
ncbi:Hypothetical_protein [Hexamita inflata]|uniref:Hypothetical_protein n=1 Tax=Hexamita inflata TaxID=28002 RepID=A0AA86NE58_9EUKA|nr:Hypothetical protein HINF_LOCUS5515 [Hexamita inflata]CAI9941243.1 Hypothetical protein HINF_LOCUS28888 [Hexamita inflata]